MAAREELLAELEAAREAFHDALAGSTSSS